MRWVPQKINLVLLMNVVSYQLMKMTAIHPHTATNKDLQEIVKISCLSIFISEMFL